MLKISLVTDELSADPETALELATSWGIRAFELRGYFAERVPQLTNYQNHNLRRILEDYGAHIVALSPGLFKMPYPPGAPESWSFTSLDAGAFVGWESAHQLVQRHVTEILPQTLNLANALGARTVVIFGFHRGGAAPAEAPPAVIDTLHMAAESAARAGITLALETEEGYWADTGERTARIIKQVNHPALRVNWDPGNAFCAGDTPFPVGYGPLRGLIHHVHFKDARRLADGSVEFVTLGEIDWRGQIQALISDGYDGYISIETHLRPKIASARASFERLQNLIHEAGQD
jgi:sugar phosphate isomerase/epimerase